MKKFIRTTALALATVLMFGCTACNKPVVPPDNPNTSDEPTQKPQEATAIYVPVGTGAQIEEGLPDAAFVNASNAFAAALLAEMGKDWTGVLSPLSLQLSLMLLANGADETLCEEMLSALETDKTIADANLNAAKLIRALCTAKGNAVAAKKETGCIFNISNAVLTGNDDVFTSDFENIASDYFKAAIGNIDFKDSKKALKTINEWAKTQTHGLVENLFDEISPETCMALLNAVYFKGAWKTPFIAFRQQSDFHGTNGDTRVTMLNTTGKYRYGSFNEGEMILLPYQGGEYFMAVVLPKEGGYTPAAALSVLMGKWNDCTEQNCKFSMPTLSLNTNFDARNALSQMGFADAAQGKALFPRIIKNASAFITQIVHGAHLNITAMGTEAGAATGSTGEKNAPVGADIVMNCDRPYAMAIVNAETGAVVFVSAVNNIDTAFANPQK